MIAREEIPDWLLGLDPEDINFIRKFVLLSGSLKDMAKEYQVSYPTLRARLDKLISKIEIAEKKDDDFIITVKRMVLDDKISFEAAKEIISEYRKEK